MAEYINREALMDEIKRIGGHNLCGWDTIGVKALVERQHAADVVEVRHGEWEFFPDCCRCSECSMYSFGGSLYCPNCGAKMDGKGEGE